MMREYLVAARLIDNDGKFDRMRAALLGVPLLALVLWRLASGTVGEAYVLDTIRERVLDDYREGVYAAHGMYDEDAVNNGAAANFPTEELQGLLVMLDDVSIAAPLLSVSATENVGVRFDYRILREGHTKAHGDGVYLCVDRERGVRVWSCGMVSYYLRYL